MRYRAIIKCLDGKVMGQSSTLRGGHSAKQRPAGWSTVNSGAAFSAVQHGLVTVRVGVRVQMHTTPPSTMVHQLPLVHPFGHSL